MSVLLNTEYTLASPTFVGADGETPADCASDPTCEIVRDDGTELTDAVVSDASGNGNYAAAITTDHTSQLDLLTVTWSGTAGGLDQVYKQQLEVAGGWYVTIPEVRAEPDLSNTAAALIRRERDRFEALAEDYCSVAFVPRYKRLNLYGGSCGHILLPVAQPREILSLTVGDDTEDPADYTLDPIYGLVKLSGSIPRSSTNGPNVTIGLTYGYDFPPADLKEACLAFIRSKATARKTGVPNTAMEGSDTTRSWTYGAPGKDKPTGIESVDEVLNRLNETIPGIA